MYEIKNSKKVELTDRVRFRCIRCAECCRNVEGTVVIEVKDAYYLAKHLNITVTEFYEKYTRMFLLEDTGFPIFTLETTGKDNACIFLSKRRCSVQDAKPRTCKMYPFWICPDDNGGFQYNYSTERRHHPKGSLVRVKDWMKENLSDEDKEFLTEDTRSLTEIAPLFNILHKRLELRDAVMSKILMFRHFMYETDEPFYEQFCRNNRLLKRDLQNMINNLENGGKKKNE